LSAAELTDDQKTKLMKGTDTFSDQEVELLLDQHANDHIYKVTDNLTQQLRCHAISTTILPDDAGKNPTLLYSVPRR
jgi:hypothetical protein